VGRGSLTRRRALWFGLARRPAGEDEPASR
jgi:hypothetical protein